MTTAPSLLAPYVLPPPRHADDAFEPAIDAATMRLQREHHQACVDGVNAALAEAPDWQGLTIEALLRRLPEVPEAIRPAVRHHGGGHANHQFFWKILTPHGAGQSQGDLAAAIARDFGGVDALQARFAAAASEQLGTGWAFLVCKPREAFRLDVLTLPGNDSVLTLPEPSPGLLCCDLWEHAHLLRHGNDRAGWVRAFWGLVDWAYVGERLDGIKAGRQQL